MDRLPAKSALARSLTERGFALGFPRSHLTQPLRVLRNAIVEVDFQQASVTTTAEVVTQSVDAAYREDDVDLTTSTADDVDISGARLTAIGEQQAVANATRAGDLANGLPSAPSLTML